jgi:tetratricopeptide (TPR) repeat protein
MRTRFAEFFGGCAGLALALPVSLVAREPEKLLNAVKPSAVTEALETATRVDRTREDLRKMLYGDRRTDPDTAFGEQASAFAAAVLACLDEERRVPNPDRYRACLFAAHERWNQKLVALAYPNRRDPLCDVPKEPVREKARPLGFDQRDDVEAAEAALRSGDISEAAEQLDRALLAVDASLAKTNGATPRCEPDNGAPVEASALAVDGTYCRALVARARLHGRNGAWEKSLELLDKALRLRPLHPETLLERARTLHELRRRKDTIATASLLLKQAQRRGVSPALRAEAYALRARAETALGNLKEARSDIAQALALQPDNATYRDELRYVDSLFQQKR